MAAVPPDSNDVTRLAGSPAPTTTTGWLSSSGSIDHGRFEPGTILDNRYRVLGLLGRGGMGEVFRADDLRLGQPVALKFLPSTLSHDPVRLAQFHNEVRTARQVSHANVCRVYDIGEIDGQLFLTMEYVDGEDLASLLRRIGRLPEDKGLEIARQICAGLAAAHERGVLHRDLKPANVMLDGSGKAHHGLQPRGGWRHCRHPRRHTGLHGSRAARRAGSHDAQVLYEIFTGRRAFDAETLSELIQQHQSGTLTAPTTIVKSLDPAIEAAIVRCLDPSPMRRPPSAIAVSAAVRPVDWQKLFTAAGLDMSAFTPTTPSRTPATYADERKAWKGTLTDTAIPVTVEAAGYRGRPVLFEIVAPWTPSPREPAPVPPRGTSPVFVYFLLLGAGAVAYWNVRRGRGDVSGAFRVAAFMTLLLTATWAVSPHVGDLGQEQERFFADVGLAMFVGGAMYILYLGLEPYVRRAWPDMLVG